MGFLSPHFLLISNCAEMTRFFLQFSERDGLLLQNVGEDKNIAIYPMISSPKCITATFFYKLIKVDNIRYCILSFLTIHETEGTSFWCLYNHVRFGEFILWSFILLILLTNKTFLSYQNEKWSLETCFTFFDSTNIVLEYLPYPYILLVCWRQPWIMYRCYQVFTSLIIGLVSWHLKVKSSIDQRLILGNDVLDWRRFLLSFGKTLVSTSILRSAP